jgi:hypoxanthine phosphoribosyltransferase
MLTETWQQQGAAERGFRVAKGLLSLGTATAAARFAIAARLRSRESFFRLGRLVAKADWITSQRGQLLLDQGLLQELWSILFASDRFDPNPLQISALLSQLYKGVDARIVFIDIEPELAARRICQRTDGDSRLDGLPQSQVLFALSHGKRISDAILEGARTAGLRPIMSSGTAGSKAQLEQLRPLLSDGTEPANDSTARPKLTLTLEQAESLARELAAAVESSGQTFDLVVGIARGGVHPAVHTAQSLGLPLQVLHIERDATRFKKKFDFLRKALSLPGVGKPLRRLNRLVDRRFTGVRSNSIAVVEVRGRRILLVDDCIDSGASVALARSLLARQGASDIKLAVLCWTTKYDSSRLHGIAPDYFLGRRLPSYPWSADNPDYPRFQAWFKGLPGNESSSSDRPSYRVGSG